MASLLFLLSLVTLTSLFVSGSRQAADKEAIFRLLPAKRRWKVVLDELVKANAILVATNATLVATNARLSAKINKGNSRSTNSGETKLCPHCKRIVFHAPTDCFELEKNKDKRPASWTTCL